MFGDAGESSYLYHDYEGIDTIKESKRSYRNISSELDLSGQLLYYPFGDYVYIGFQSSLDNSGGFGKNAEFERYDTFVNTDTLFTRVYSEEFSFSPRIGFGRIRQIEYAANALEIEEVLRKELDVSRNPQLVKEVAELYAKRWEYPIKYWHPDWEFYEDLEEIFEKYGISHEDIRIKTWMQIMDASAVWGSRPYGIKISFISLGLTQGYNIRTEERPESMIYYPPLSEISENYNANFGINGLYVDWGYPLSYKTHLAGSFNFSANPGLNFGIQHRAIYRTGAYYPDSLVEDTIITEAEINQYEVNYSISSLTWLWSHLGISPEFSGSFGKESYYYNGYEDSTTLSWLSNGITLSAAYYFTNKFSFHVSGGLSTYLQRIGDLPVTFSASPSARVSLSYRIF